MDVAVNYWAILACGAAAMVVGFMWYGPIFGAWWSRLSGFTDADMEAAKANPWPMYRSYALTFVGALLMAYVLHHGLVFGNAYLQMSGVTAGLIGTFWFWLGFVVPVSISDTLWGRNSWTLWMLNAAYWLVQLWVMAIILSLWM